VAVSLVTTVPFSDGTTTGGTSTTGTVPSATTAVGDTAIFFMCQNAGSSAVFTAPTGWSTVAGPDQTGSTSAERTQVYGKDLVSGDLGSSVTFSSSGSGTRTFGVLVIFRGTSLASITAPAATTNTTNTTSITSPAVTTTVASSWVVGLWAVRVATAAPAPTLSYPGTETFIDRSRTAFTASPNYTAEVSRLTTPGAAGSYGGITATASATTSNQHAYTLIVPPGGTGQSGTATAAGTGAATVGNLVTHPYAESAAGVGSVTVSGLVTKIDGVLAPAGVGSVTVTGATSGGSAAAVAGGVGSASVAAAGGTSQISFVGSAAAQTPVETPPATTSIVSALPAGVQANDLILLAVHRSQDYAISSTPTGYISLDTVVDTGTSPTATATDIYYRFADGTESTTGPTFSVATATRFIVHSAVYRGVDTTAPFIAHGGQATATSTANRVAPALTNTNTNAWAVYATALRQVASPVSFTPPTGMTERQDTDIGVTTTTNLAAEWAGTAAAIGSTGSITYTGTSSGATSISTAWAAFLKPAAVVAPVVGALSAGGTGAATIGGPVVVVVSAAGAGAASASAALPVDTIPGVDTASATGAATVGNTTVRSGTETAAGVGTATVTGLVIKIDGVLRPAGVGTATVTGLGILVAPSHVTTQATIAFNGIATATLLAVSPGIATLASDGTSDAELASDGTSTATVLAVPPGVATIQTT
jgi:hypothetical protein